MSGEGFVKRWVDPITYKRLLRFRHMKRAWYSFLILSFFYIISLGAELIANDRPLYLHFEGERYFPVFFFYPENIFTGSGRYTRPDYKELAQSDAFTADEDNYMIFPLIPYGPNEIIDRDSIELPDEVTVRITREPRLASIDVDREFQVTRAQQAEWFFGGDGQASTLRLDQHFDLPRGLIEAVEHRFANREAPFYSEDISAAGREINIRMTPYKPRGAPPRTVRLILTERVEDEDTSTLRYSPEMDDAGIWDSPLWERLPEDEQRRIFELAAERMSRIVDPIQVSIGEEVYSVVFGKEDVNYPFRPVENHPFGIDNAGRDVLSRVFYGLRTSLNFGLLLVIAAIALGTVAGAIQGYFGGRIDLYAQRFTEIWESLPFLYVLILMGSVYGQSFMLLVIVYGIFNWIGISYYMRAEFLRIRNQPFVEAARCLGIPDRKIIMRHILPNALVPLITFFPFLLVSAIGTLAALDYLGFGLPPPAPSWGELLAQAQEVPRWWLIFYPSMALFIVMLLGVFIGEGVRSAFDPRKHIQIE